MKRVKELQENLNEVIQSGREEKDQLMEKLKDEEHVKELKECLSTFQQTQDDYRPKESYEWVISRDEIFLTDEMLGEGAWGNVLLGRFRGCKLAVKQVHSLVLSPSSRSSFQREMKIASRCRHPYLLQFTGATNDEGTPLLVTELIETSLRALLDPEFQPLSDSGISIISSDVALAFNYLHQTKPLPIIHRDLSGANVLLWRHGLQWRGKVSDYGTTNFMQQTMTVAPGATIYSAPEALTSNQTIKVG